jgi:mannose-6-phosphate isomerase-like protein (cupin superfamily)
MNTLQSLPVQGFYLSLSDKTIHLLQKEVKHSTGQDHWFVLEGAVTFLLEGQPLEASAGDHITVAKGALQAVQNCSSTPSKIVRVTLPVHTSSVLVSDFAGAYD